MKSLLKCEYSCLMITTLPAKTTEISDITVNATDRVGGSPHLQRLFMLDRPRAPRRGRVARATVSPARAGRDPYMDTDDKISK